MDNTYKYTILGLFLVNILDDVCCENCYGKYFNWTTSTFKDITLHCVTGCCGNDQNPKCCSQYQSKSQIGTASIMGILFAVVAGAIIFFGFCICCYKLCFAQTFRDRSNDTETPNQESGQTQQPGLSVISNGEIDSLPKYEDLPPSYDEAMSGHDNFGFVTESGVIIQPPEYTENNEILPT